MLLCFAGDIGYQLAKTSKSATKRHAKYSAASTYTMYHIWNSSRFAFDIFHTHCPHFYTFISFQFYFSPIRISFHIFSFLSFINLSLLFPFLLHLTLSLSSFSLLFFHLTCSSLLHLSLHPTLLFPLVMSPSSRHRTGNQTGVNQEFYNWQPLCKLKQTGRCSINIIKRPLCTLYKSYVLTCVLLLHYA